MTANFFLSKKNTIFAGKFSRKKYYLKRRKMILRFIHNLTIHISLRCSKSMTCILKFWFSTRSAKSLNTAWLHTAQKMANYYSKYVCFISSSKNILMDCFKKITSFHTWQNDLINLKILRSSADQRLHNSNEQNTESPDTCSLATAHFRSFEDGNPV